MSSTKTSQYGSCIQLIPPVVTLSIISAQTIDSYNMVGGS
jgi:hypothetical protein